MNAKEVVDRRRNNVQTDDQRPELLPSPFHGKALPTGANRLLSEGLYSYNGLTGLPSCIGRSILERLGCELPWPLF